MKAIKPLSFVQSLVLFGLSALLFRLSVYNLMPALLSYGILPFWSFIISYGIPLLILLVATFFFVAREGNLQHWRIRLRLNRLTGKQILWCLGLFALSFLLTGLLIPTAKYIASMSFLMPPDFLPDVLNPNKTVPGKALTTFMGVSLKGAYWVVLVYFIFLTLLNILGEELWFRGYILPRQELTWGKRTWIYHGIFWCLFHTPIYPWTILYLLPTTLTVSYAAYRFQNTWAGFIIHYLGNGLLALLPILIGIMK